MFTKKLLMTGEFVKNKLKKAGFALKTVAESMGVSQQDLQSKLRTSDIKTGVLESIANAINKNVYFFYDESWNNKYKSSEQLSFTANESESIYTSNKFEQAVTSIIEKNQKKVFDSLLLDHLSTLLRKAEEINK